MYIQGMAQQTQVFMLSTGFGFILGAVYDIMVFIRKTISHGHIATVVQDIVFSLFCTVSVFLFLLCIDDGRLRLYPYLGMAAGFFIWRFTLGVPLGYVFGRLSAFLRGAIKPLKEKVIFLFKNAIKKLKKMKIKH